MITYEKLVEINQKLDTIHLKGKDYVMVNDRIKGFRELCPSGSITSEIVSLNNGICTIKATVKDEEGNVLGTGYAQEKETSSFVNKTSYIENCETSAVGRALGFAGIGVDGSMASADELANAIMNQNGGQQQAPVQKTQSKKKPQTKGGIESEKFNSMIAYLKKENLDVVKVAKEIGVASLEEMTGDQWNAWLTSYSEKKKGENNGK